MSKVNLILQSRPPAKVLMEIKKQTGLGLSELNARIRDQQPLMEGNTLKSQDMNKFISVIQSLRNENHPFALFETVGNEREEMPLELFMNSIERAHQIAAHREFLDALTIEEDTDEEN
ncbi:hypothetical protein ACX93W_02440 [Paenibacillus sp. CAU 1782]